MQNRRQVRILVLDIDDCTFSSISPRADMLSEPILKQAQDGNYDLIIGCTHRSAHNLQFCYIDALRIASKHHNYNPDAIAKNFSTTAVLNKISTLTGIKLHTVSMHDDIKHGIDGCGKTYDEAINEYDKFCEEFGLTHSKNPDSFDLFCKLKKINRDGFLSLEDAVREWHTKNVQLRQIAHLARKLYPDADIILDYFDDNKVICEAATNAMFEDGWQTGVTLKVHNYDYVNKKIIPMERQADATLAAASVFKPPKPEAGQPSLSTRSNSL